MADISRFIKAQEGYPSYEQALREIQNGQKRSHWIWYIFPQVRGLGFSSYATYYGIESLDEAREYLSDAVLGARFREITAAVISHREDNIVIIMGSGIDAMKFHSSMTLFDLASPNEIFHEALITFFSGKRDDATLKIFGL